jgi:ABC-type nitrate/sulfonate/bicarbonate transport system substrate-binding protein
MGRTARSASLCGVLAMLAFAPLPAPAQDLVVIGFGPSLTSALDIIADSQGFFAAEGLRVEQREFTRGSKAMEALVKGEIDISSSTGFALTAASFAERRLRVVSTVATAGNDNQIVARRDRGVVLLPDLRGKRVGVVKSGMSQYVLDLMLMQGGMTARDVTIVHQEPPQLVKLLLAGELDAVCIFGAWVDQARRELGEKAAVITDESLVRITTFMTAMAPRIGRDPGLFTRVLKAYIRAEEFIRANPDRAREIVVKRFALDDEAARKLWKPNLFHVALDQSTLDELDNMARWMVDTGQAKADDYPNFLDLIWFDTLERIDPRRVSIIH